MKKYAPQQGDIVFISFSPTAGHEQSGKRPALVVSATEYNIHSGMMLAVPITSKGKGYDFEVQLTNNKTKGVILCDHLRSMDWFARRPTFVEKCDTQIFDIVKNVIASLMQ